MISPSSCQPHVLYPHLVLVLTQLSFSGWHLLSAIALQDGANPLIFALYREVTASICMLLYSHYYLKFPIKVNQRDLIRFIIIGACSFVNVVGTVFALNFIAASKYALFQPSIPCIAASISILAGIEAPSVLKLSGIVLAAVGALIVELWKIGGSDSRDKNETLGTTLVILQCTCMACIIVLQKPLLYKYEPSVVTFVFYSIGTVITIVVALAWIPWLTTSSLTFESQILPWIALVYAVIFATLMAYNFYSWAGRQLLPSVTTAYCTLQPVFTCLLCLVVLGQTISWGEITGGFVVMGGLFITVYGQANDHSQSISQSLEVPTATLLTHEIDATVNRKGYSSVGSHDSENG